MILEFEVPDEPKEFAWYFIRELLMGAARGCRPLFVGPYALPPLYETNVRYDIGDDWGSGRQRIALPFQVLAEGKGSCGPLSVYEVARRMAHGGKDEIALADWLKDGGMHAQIRHEDNQIEDPSIALGAPVDWPLEYVYDL